MIIEIINILLALGCIPIHELGHYFSAKLLGMKAILNMKKTQVWVEYDSEFKHIITLISGVVVGLIPILLIADDFLKYSILIAYVYACSLDLLNIIRIIAYYLNFNVPEPLLRLERIIKFDQHYKFCPCTYCTDQRNNAMFFYRG